MSEYHYRKGIDRRQAAASPFSIYCLIGRRRAVRRGVDRNSVAAQDSYPPIFMAIVVGIMVLCVADAFNTLQIITLGGLELNPLMDVLLGHGHMHFVMAKLALTGLGVLVLVAYHHKAIFRWLKVRHMLYLVLFGYVGLIYYQSMLMPPDVVGLVLPI